MITVIKTNLRLSFGDLIQQILINRIIIQLNGINRKYKILDRIKNISNNKEAGRFYHPASISFIS